MIPMPAGLVRGLWRAVECPSMTIGGCLSSRRTFSTLMELWTRLRSLFQSPRPCSVCACARASHVDGVFPSRRENLDFLFLFLKVPVPPKAGNKAKLQSLLIHKYLCYTGSLTWQLELPHPLFPVNNANKTALVCSTFTRRWFVACEPGVCACARE